MRRAASLAMLLPLVLVPWAMVAGDGPQQNWTNYVRIGAYDLTSENADAIVADARATRVFGIEVDNDIPGRYESFLDPTEKLNAIRAVAEKAHQAHNYAFVYIAGTECITAHADQTPAWQDVPLQERMPYFPGAQIQVTIPERIAR